MHVAAYRIPTDQAESDGTLQWDATTMVVVQASNGDTDRHWLHLHPRGGRYAHSMAICGGWLEGTIRW